MDVEQSKQALRQALNICRNGESAADRRQNTRENDGYDDMLESIESMEQAIMQHIRTSGLKKNRECAIIEEVLNLRKKRKQVFASIIKDVNSLQEYSATVENALSREREAANSRSSVVESSLRGELQAQSKEIHRLKEAHRAKLEEMKDSQRQLMDMEISRVKSRYESKLRLLEEKVGAVQSASAGYSEEQLRRGIEAKAAAMREEHSKTVTR